MISTARLLKAVRWAVSSDAGRRRRVRQECARVAASLFGDFPISDDYSRWREDKDFLATFRRLSPHSPYSQDRKFVLRELVRSVAGLDGDMAECGCFEGASAFFMADELPDVPLHLFDSFEGLSDPSGEDEARQGDMAWAAGDMAAGEDVVLATLEGFANVNRYKGWIPDRFSEVSERRFRFVHVDVDLYQPTLDCLEFFYPRVPAHGVVLLDDYGSLKCPGAYQATVEFMQDKPEHILLLPTGQGLFFKRS